ncbi:MAG: DUF1802 family protein [Candidatus Binatia bacterium]
MRPTNSLALKEWAVVVHALGAGTQMLLLRKGGLHERRGQFATDPAEFFLFSTFVHQMAQGVVSEAAGDLRAVAVMESQPPAEQLVIDHYATVEDLVWLDSRDRLDALAGLHCWTPETVAQRFVYGKTPGIHLFILRVYRLPQAYTLPLLKRYGGCRSWVELEQSLSTEGAVPVLDEEAFAEQRRQIKEKLAEGAVFEVREKV